MKKIMLILFVSLLGANAAFAIPKEIENALKLNRINHFDEALELINDALREEKIKPDITSAYTIGRILYRKGELYREMSRISILTQIGHLLQIREQERELSDELKLFLGIGYFYMDRYLDAAGILNLVLQNRSIDNELYALTHVYLGASYYQSGEKNKAEDLWKKVKKENQYAYSALGYMYAYLRLNPSSAELMIKGVLEEDSARRSYYLNSIKIYHAYALMAMGKFSDAFNEVSEVNLDKPIYIYKPEERTEIRFYDLAVLDSYSKILFGESIKNLEPVVTASSGELASFSSYYVAQMYLYLEDFEKSLKYTDRARKLSVSSSLTMIRAMACETSVYYLSGKERRGDKVIRKEIEKIYGKPSFLLEMLKVVISSGVNYEWIRDIVNEVEAYVYETEWDRTRRDSALLGEISFFTGRNVRALYYLEKARDKGNKNKIETNDPTFLLKLSYVYYSRDDFSESLEILFSLSNSFSGVRPLQDAVQSVYSYKQKGIGEALIE
jgi:tetratricopeptide (TPR) repeat protein